MNAIKRFFLRLLILLIAAGMVGAMLVLFINSRVKHSTEDQILYLIQGETEISALGQESLKDFGADCALVLAPQPSGNYRGVAVMSLARAYACARVVSAEQPAWLAADVALA